MGPSPDAAAAATTTTTAAGTTSTPQIESVQTKGAIEIESGDDESASEASDSPSESEAELLIPSREEIAQILGLPHKSGPTGLVKLVGAMTVDQAFDQHALPCESTEELQKAFSDKLASVPWLWRLPKNVLNPGRLHHSDASHDIPRSTTTAHNGNQNIHQARLQDQHTKNVS